MDSHGKRYVVNRNKKTQADSAGKQLLENAYELETPDDNRTYYDELARSYDEDFANGLQYRLPTHVYDVFSALANPEDSPILDVGCGTGLLGGLLSASECVVDGADISPAMLRVCKEKGVYRQLFEVDLTESLANISNGYGAVLSSGTFTHGHLGTEPFVALLDVANPNALFVITINKVHFEQMGFSATVDGLIESNRIKSLKVSTVNIYANSDHAHSADEGLVVSFRKA